MSATNLTGLEPKKDVIENHGNVVAHSRGTDKHLPRKLFPPPKPWTSTSREQCWPTN